MKKKVIGKLRVLLQNYKAKCKMYSKNALTIDFFKFQNGLTGKLGKKNPKAAQK